MKNLFKHAKLKRLLSKSFPGKKIIITDNNKKDIACEKFKFFMRFELIICEARRIKKGFINSIG